MIEGAESELRQRVIDHPWQAVGLAALLGATFGVMAAPRGKLGELFAVTVGALATRYLRNTVVSELAASARRWKTGPRAVS